MSARYDLIIVGTGFAGAFFLMRYLERAPATVRVLVLERGGSDDKSWQMMNRRTSSIAPDEVFHNLTPKNPGTPAQALAAIPSAGPAARPA